MHHALSTCIIRQQWGGLPSQAAGVADVRSLALMQCNVWYFDILKRGPLVERASVGELCFSLLVLADGSRLMHRSAYGGAVCAPCAAYHHRDAVVVSIFYTLLSWD